MDFLFEECGRSHKKRPKLKPMGKLTPSEQTSIVHSELVQLWHRSENAKYHGVSEALVG